MHVRSHKTLGALAEDLNLDQLMSRSYAGSNPFAAGEPNPSMPTEGQVADRVSAVSVAGGLAATGGGLLTGALVGGLASGSWKGAGTGALLAGGARAATLGVGFALMGSRLSSETDAASMSLAPRAKALGIGMTVVGLGLFGWGGYRGYKTVKGKR